MEGTKIEGCNKASLLPVFDKHLIAFIVLYAQITSPVYDFELVFQSPSFSLRHPE